MSQPLHPACSLGSLLDPVPQWIWSPNHNAGHVPQASCHFRRTIRLDGGVRSAQLAIAADDRFELFLNGKRVGEGTSDQGIVSFEVGDRLRKGANVVAVRVSNRKGVTAGLALRLNVLKQDQKELTFVSDGSWRTSLSPLPLWNLNSYSDRRWSSAKPVGEFSDFVSRQFESSWCESRSAKGFPSGEITTIADDSSKATVSEHITTDNLAPTRWRQCFAHDHEFAEIGWQFRSTS